jgi:hypothetical protein
MLRLTWYMKDTDKELKAYDLIGVQYFYMGNLEKANFYHNKMLRGECEND